MRLSARLQRVGEVAKCADGPETACDKARAELAGLLRLRDNSYMCLHGMWYVRRLWYGAFDMLLSASARDGCYNSVRRAFMKQVLANSGYIERNELIPWTVGESENTARFLEQIRPVRQLVVAGMVEGFFPATLAAQRLRSMGLLAGFAFIGYARREEEAGQYAAQTVFIHEQDIPRLACLPDRQTLFVDDVIQHGETINAVSNALYVRFGITHINTAFLRDLRQKQR